MPNRTAGGLGPALRVTWASALYGFAVALEDFLHLFLRQDSGEALWSALERNLEFLPVMGATVGYAVLGLAIALGLATVVSRYREIPLEDSLRRVAPAYACVLVPIGLNLAAMLSLTLSPSFPYGSNLAVSLALEGWFEPMLTLMLFVSSLAHSIGVGVERPLGRGRWLGPTVILTALLLFALSTPSHFYEEGAGQGNMFKYVRIASAVAGSGTLDIGRAAENRDASFVGFLSHVPRMASSYASESRKLLSRALDAIIQGQFYWGEPTASRANRSMFRSASGGIYYINAPGPGLLLVPAYLLDRTLNRWLGTERQVAMIVFWQLLGAILVYQIVLAASELTERTAAILTAFAFALSVPALFYSFQIYPELPAGLFLLFAFRKLVIDPSPGFGAALAAGVALAALPWLHQKYSVVAATLGLYAVFRLVGRTRRGISLRPMKLLALGTPLALSAYSLFLYNHALTGSLSPTATFSAAERSSFEPQNMVKGLLGLLLDRDNGLFVFAPVYLLSLVGMSAFVEEHRRLARPYFLTLISYLLVIASFPYWPGAISTMGRYISSLLPLLALPLALAAGRAMSQGAIAGSALTLLAASLAYSASFTRDLIPSYDAQLLWSRTLYSDPSQYLPSFLSDGFLGSGPAHFAKVLVILLGIAILVYWLQERARVGNRRMEDEAGRFPQRACLGAAAVLASVVGMGALLENWPGNEPATSRPRYRDTLSTDSGIEVWVDGEHGFEGPAAWVPGGGESRFHLHSHRALSSLTLLLTNGPDENEVLVTERGGSTAVFVLPPDGPHERKVLLRNPHRFEGPKGESFLYELRVRSRGSFVPARAGRGEDERRLGVYVRVP
ncbi:MAG TPA: hypothetical protein VEK15_21615 [Vicinamibacteria bacterium]|nr:hypothetical protein [Vicinamibacteria bacterium]